MRTVDGVYLYGLWEYEIGTVAGAARLTDGVGRSWTSLAVEGYVPTAAQIDPGVVVRGCGNHSGGACKRQAILQSNRQ